MTKTLLAAFLGLSVCAVSLAQVTGRNSASGSTKATLSFPSLHGFDAAEGPPSGGVRTVSNASRQTLESRLRIAMINTNPDEALIVHRTVVGSGEPSLARTALGRETPGAAVAETASFARREAFGWRRLEDRVRGPEVLHAASGERAQPEAVVYELWHF